MKQTTDDLKVIRQKPNEYLIESLEKVLEQAKEGTLQGIAYVKLFDNGNTAHGWNIPGSQSRRIPSLIGGAQIMATDLANELTGIEPGIIKDG